MRERTLGIAIFVVLVALTLLGMLILLELKDVSLLLQALQEELIMLGDT